MDEKDLPIEDRSHPRPELLAAYSEERLSETEMDEVREHLAACPACADVVLDLLELELNELEEADEPLPLERERSWRNVRESLREAGLVETALPAAIPAPATAPAPLPFRPAATAPYWRPLALAASLALALMATWTFSLQRQLGAARAPRVDPPLASLMPLHVLRTGEPEKAERLTLLPGERGWLVLTHTERERPARTRLRFRRPGQDAVVWETEARPTDPRSIRLELTLDQVPPGSYEVELAAFEQGERGGSWRTFATYRLDVAAISSG